VDAELLVETYTIPVSRLRQALCRASVKLLAHQVSWRRSGPIPGTDKEYPLTRGWVRMTRHLLRVGGFCDCTRLAAVRMRQ
jgi:hypothetical protein